MIKTYCMKKINRLLNATENQRNNAIPEYNFQIRYVYVCVCMYIPEESSVA